MAKKQRHTLKQVIVGVPLTPTDRAVGADLLTS